VLRRELDEPGAVGREQDVVARRFTIRSPDPLAAGDGGMVSASAVAIASSSMLE
jgi:hypothetical protein